MYVLGRITQKLWTKFDKIIAVYCIWDTEILEFRANGVDAGSRKPWTGIYF